MTNIKNKMKAVDEEREASMRQVEKYKSDFAKYIISEQEKIRHDVEHPYVVTKKDIRKKKRETFFNKLKKALGIYDTEN